MALGDNFMWDPDGVIVGETTDSCFSGCKAFEVQKWRFKVDNGSDSNYEDEGDDDGDKKSRRRRPKTGVISGKLKFNEIQVDKVVDSASTFLYKACCTEDCIPSLMMATRAAGGDALIYLQYMFRDNHVTSMEWSGGSGTERAQEVFTLSFKAMGMQYIQQGPGGKPLPLKRWDWNVVDNDGDGSADLDIVKGHPMPRFLLGNTKFAR